MGIQKGNAFIDFQKAYNSLRQEGLINILVEFHFLHELINFIKSSIMETYIKVRIGVIKSEQISVRTGLRRGRLSVTNII